MVDFAWCTPHACTQCASDGFSRQSIDAFEAISPIGCDSIAVPVYVYTLSLLDVSILELNLFTF